MRGGQIKKTADKHRPPKRYELYHKSISKTIIRFDMFQMFKLQPKKNPRESAEILVPVVGLEPTTL